MSTTPRRMTTAGWHKSSYSSSTGSCVEVRPTGEVLSIRDSKNNGAGPVLTVPRQQWQSFLRDVVDDTDTNPALRIIRHRGGDVVLQERGGLSPVSLTYTPSEWDAFTAGVRAGEFSPHHAMSTQTTS